ncbi:MAG: hypothetical protein KKA61_02090 [Nanoarchaeota archaeon]|nr:hypothetical protein [Nanoarchaeota archaeon]MBU4493134.1 hypothetical protein [Nanoarchaeota archaeon]
MRNEQYLELRGGLVNVIEKLNEEFPNKGKFYLKKGNGNFRILSKEHFYSKPFEWAIIEYHMGERIGYKPIISNLKPKEVIDQYLEEFSERHNVRLGSLWG